MYGAGPILLGSIVAPEGSPKRQKTLGLQLKKRFLAGLPALGHLLSDVEARVKTKGWLRGLDGRRLKVRSVHSALNLLLQSAGAVLMKYATVKWHWLMEAEGYVYGQDYIQVAHVHDEVQAAGRTREIAERSGQLFVQAIEEAGRYFNFRCPMTGEYKLGSNWAETH